MSSKSLSDIAFSVLSNQENDLLFVDLWTKVAEEAGLNENMKKKKVASFYNALMLDSRFISLEGNRWDLRERQADDALKIDPDLLDNYDDYDEFENEEDYILENEEE